MNFCEACLLDFDFQGERDRERERQRERDTHNQTSIQATIFYSSHNKTHVLVYMHGKSIGENLDDGMLNALMAKTK